MSSSNNNNNKQSAEASTSTLIIDRSTKNTHTMSNINNKQPLDLSESLPIFDNKAQSPSTSRVQSAEASTTTPTVNKLDYDGISMVERKSRDVKPWEKNDSLGISEINETPYYVDKSDGETIGFLLDCAKRGENLSHQRRPSICKVSRILRDFNEISYEPQLVSIGPIHKEDPKLQEFERQKECYISDLLDRFDSTPMETLEACVRKVSTLIPEIRESYAGVKMNYSDAGLVKMMVMDGCFILEFCLKHHKENWYLPNKMQNKRIAMDLMLLENQVPFSVLQALFDCSMGKDPTSTLTNVLDNYLAPYIKLFREKNSTTDVDSDSTHDHVLGYLHKRCQLVAAKSSKPIHAESPKPVDEELAAKSSNPTDAEELKLIVDEERIENTYTTFHSIVELDRSGMKFKPHEENVWSMTIKYQPSLFPCLPGFWSKPTLLMPALVINYSTELILRNFIAYEQSFPQDRDCFTQYAVAMSMLIDTPEDIAKLVESKVLVNMLGSNQEAADMINKICKNIFITDFCYTQEFKQMDKHYNRFWPKQMRYFWSPISVQAALIGFYLTVVQTIFTILGYWRDCGSNQ